MKPETIINEVCKFYGIEESELFNKSHQPAIAERKHMVRKLLRESKLTLHQIGDITMCSHDNALHGIKIAQNLIDTDKKFRDDYVELKNRIGGNITTLWQLAECWTARIEKLRKMDSIAGYVLKRMENRMINIIWWAKKMNLK